MDRRNNNAVELRTNANSGSVPTQTLKMQVLFLRAYVQTQFEKWNQMIRDREHEIVHIEALDRIMLTIRRTLGSLLEITTETSDEAHLERIRRAIESCEKLLSITLTYFVNIDPELSVEIEHDVNIFTNGVLRYVRPVVPVNLDRCCMVASRMLAYQSHLPERVTNNSNNIDLPIPPANNEVIPPIIIALTVLRDSWLCLDKSAQLGAVFDELVRQANRAYYAAL